jgi:hypothetical protein
MQNLTEKLEPTFVVNREQSGRGRYQLDGKPLTGCTTICNMQNKPFLVDWAAKEAYLDARGRTPEDIDSIIKRKDYAHKHTAKHSTDKGTIAHAFVEEFIKSYLVYKEYFPKISEDEEVNTSIQRFYKWAIDNKVEFVGTEISVYSRKHWFAGSFDFICKINGKLLLGDFKTSKQIDDTYFAQGAGYIIAVEELDPELKFDGVVVVRSTLAKEDKVWYQKSSNGKAKRMVQPAFEVAYRYDLERQKTYFLSLLNLYRYSREQEVKVWYEAPVVDYTAEDYPVNS